MFFPILLSTFLAVLNPINFGIKIAKTDIERYNILYEVHTEAVKHKCKVSYAGIDTISIQIPQNAKPIPLSYDTDFSGSVIVVENNIKLCYLFKLTEETKNISVSAYSIDLGNFSKYPELEKGKHILIIQDSNLG